MVCRGLAGSGHVEGYVWGGMDRTWVLGEIGLQFNSINSPA